MILRVPFTRLHNGVHYNRCRRIPSKRPTSFWPPSTLCLSCILRATLFCPSRSVQTHPNETVYNKAAQLLEVFFGALFGGNSFDAKRASRSGMTEL
eukprot:1785081-Pleurochrysis_carterae.AAC.2